MMSPRTVAAVTVAGALALAPMAAAGAEASVTQGIFTPVAAGSQERSIDTPSRSVARLPDVGTPSDPNPVEVLRSRPVKVDMKALSVVRRTLQEGGAAQLRLNLFSDVEPMAVITRATDTRYGYSLSGGVAGDPHGAVTLVVHDDIVAGAVHSEEGVFVIASRNGAIHTVREVSGQFKCGVDGLAHFAESPRDGRVSPRSDTDGDDGSEVDLLVLFTQAALDVEGSLQRMRAGVDLAVAWANDAYDASGVDLRLNLVAAVQVDYLEARPTGQGLTNQGIDMSRLIDPADGFMDEAHALRDRYAADIIHLIVDQPGGGGLGRLLRVEDPAVEAVSISINPYRSWPMVLTHELGHVMGLLHDRYEEGRRPFGDPMQNLLSPWSYGYVNQRAFDSGAPEGSRWRTIMSYDSQCRDEGIRCRQLQRFSNPRHSYPDETGAPLGVPGEERTDAVGGPADAVRSLNENRRLVARFRQSATRCDYRLSEERRVVPASGGVFSVEVDASSSCTWSTTTFKDFLSIESNATGRGSGQARFRVEANDGPARVGYVVVAGETLSVYQSGAVAPTNVCDRTPQIRDAIASAVGHDCGQVTEFDLLEVVALDLRNQGMTSLDVDDLGGLTKLTELRLSANALGTIPDGALRGLPNLKVLDLRRSRLSVTPRAIRRLPALQELDLSANDIELRQDDFRGLFELRWLALHENDIAVLPDGVFSDLRNLDYLILAWNRITDVRKEALEGPDSLRRLILNHNPIGELREDAFANVRNVVSLLLRDTQLKALPPSLISGLTRIGALDLADNMIDDVAGISFPGGNLAELDLSNNALRAIPPDIFAGFTSTNCRNSQLVLDLSGNPGAPFPLTLELDRVDAGHAAAGPASVVVRVREGAPWPIPVRVVSTGGASFARDVTIVNGETESEPFEVSGDDVANLRLATTPRLPGSYKGVRIALGEPLPLFGLDDVVLTGGAFEFDLAAAFARPGETATFTAMSSDPDTATVAVADGTLTATPGARGETVVTVTAHYGDGSTVVRSFTLTVAPDHGDVPEAATLLPIGLPFPGTIGSPEDVDVFRIDLQGSATLEVRTSGSTDTRGELLDSAGAPIVTGDDGGPGGHNFRLGAEVDAGVYYVAVTGASGDYAVTARVGGATDHGATAPTATRLTLHGADDLERVSPPVLLATLGRIGAAHTDVDVFRLDVPHDGTDVTVRSSGVSVYGRLLDASSNEIVSDTGAGRFRLEARLDAGTYYVEVWGPETGGYRVLASGDAAACTCGRPAVRDHGGDFPGSTLLPIGRPVTGTLGSARDVDVFRVDLEGQAVLEVRAVGPTDTRGELLDGAGAWLASDEDSGPGGNFRVVADLPPGPYYVRVTGEPGDYAIGARVGEAHDHGGTLATSTLLPIHPEAVLAGVSPRMLSGTAGRIETRDDVDVFRLDVAGVTDLTVRSSGGAELTARLVDTSLNEIASDQGGGNFRLAARLDAGTYYLEVRGRNAGGYRVLASRPDERCTCP